jgi:ribosomal protein L29
MKASDYRNMTIEDLNAQVMEKKAELAKMSFKHTVAGTENPMVLRGKRREIARIHTVMNEMKNNR